MKSKPQIIKLPSKQFLDVQHECLSIMRSYSIRVNDFEKFYNGMKNSQLTFRMYNSDIPIKNLVADKERMKAIFLSLKKLRNSPIIIKRKKMFIEVVNEQGISYKFLSKL